MKVTTIISTIFGGLAGFALAKPTPRPGFVAHDVRGTDGSIETLYEREGGMSKRAAFSFISTPSIPVSVCNLNQNSITSSPNPLGTLYAGDCHEIWNWYFLNPNNGYWHITGCEFLPLINLTYTLYSKLPRFGIPLLNDASRFVCNELEQLTRSL